MNGYIILPLNDLQIIIVGVYCSKINLWIGIILANRQEYSFMGIEKNMQKKLVVWRFSQLVAHSMKNLIVNPRKISIVHVELKNLSIIP